MSCVPSLVYIIVIKCDLRVYLVKKSYYESFKLTQVNQINKSIINLFSILSCLCLGPIKKKINNTNPFHQSSLLMFNKKKKDKKNSMSTKAINWKILQHNLTKATKQVTSLRGKSINKLQFQIPYFNRYFITNNILITRVFKIS